MLTFMLIGLAKIFTFCQHPCKSGEDENGVDFSDEHLVPVSGFYETVFLNDYYSKVHEILFNGLDDRPVIRFQVTPSFEPESVLDIEFDKESGKYYMNYHICKQMIRENQDSLDKVLVNKFRTEIDKESVDLLKSIFNVAIARVRYPKINKTGEILTMLDGIKYCFTLGLEGYPLRSGIAHSPSNGSKIKRLVNVGYQLINLAQSENKIVKIDGKLKKEIEKLKNDLK